MKDYAMATRFTSRPGADTGTLLAVVCAALVAVLSTASAVANDDIADKLSATLIYPDAINEGESFTLFAHVINNSNKALHFEVYTAERSYMDYEYRREFISVTPSSHTLAPGESRYMTAGRYYFAGDTLNTNAIVLDDLVMRYSGPNQDLVSAPTLPLPDITINVLDTGKSQQLNPALYPVPEREPLQVKDLVDAGDSVLIHDPNTGYDWIQLEETTHLTLQDVQYALSTNSNLQGFQLARTSQVKQLVLNHLHADGLAAQFSDLTLGPPHSLVSSIADFVELFGPGQALGNASLIYGAVADEPVVPIVTDIPMTGGLTISGHRYPPCTTFVCPATGVIHNNILTGSNNNPQRRYGFWLVRGAPELTRPSDKSGFLDDQLVVPALNIDGSTYRVVLSVLDLKLNLFVQTRLNPVAANNDAPVFKSSSGILELPDVVRINADGTTSTLDLTFRLIPDTNPPVMELIGISE